MRDTRLLDKSSFDDPNEFCEAGSTNEADMIAEWSRFELVETIQDLDEKLFQLERKLEVAVKALKFCALGEMQFTDGIEQMHKARQALAEVEEE